MSKAQTGASSMPSPLMQDEPQARVPAAPRSIPAAAQPSVPEPSAATAAPSSAAPAADLAFAAAPAVAELTRIRSNRSIAVGDVLRDRYRVQGVLGQGGMGTVFAAIDQYRLDGPNGDQLVAIKVLHTEVIKRPQLFAELRREFQHLQALSHPNIVRVHEFDRDGDLAFFTMEHLSGALLSRVLSTQGPATMIRPYALAILADVGAAVAHAHGRGVVHGDLYPGNIFITDGGEVRVLDFGASHQLHRAPWISEFDKAGRVAVATPMYASCQLLEGEAADARDDVYALACIAYMLLEGRHPFGDNTALQARTLRLTPGRPAGLGKPRWNALRAGLRFDRDQRPSDIRSWLEALDLREAATRLPPLVSMLAVASHRRAGSKWPAIAIAIAGMLVLGFGWWATADEGFRERAERAVSSIRYAITATGARLESIFASASTPTVRGEDPGGAATAQPVIEAPTVSPWIGVPAPAPEARTAPPEVRSTSPENRNTPPASRGGLPGPGAAPAAAATPAARSAPSPGATSRKVSELASSAPAQTQNANPLRARVELAADSVDVPPAESVARVMLRRSRLLRGDASFSWWTESGTAKPGQDFVPVKPRMEHIENGKTVASLIIPIVSDPARHQSRSFYVVIDQAGEDAAVGPRTLTMVTIPASD